MEATAHRNRWLKRWFTVFEMVIFHSYAQQSTIQLPSNSPVFYGGSRWLERPCLDKTRQEAPVSTQRDVAKVQRLAKASELAAGTAGMTEGGLQICGNHGIYSTVITWDKPWKWKRAKKKHEPVKISGSCCLKLKATTKIEVENLSFLDNFLWKTIALWISIAIVVFWRLLKQPRG